MRYLLAITSVLLLSFSGSGFTHHASAPHFDESKEIVLEGTVTKWNFVNPHSYIYFDVTDEKGAKQEWRCEMHARTPMQRNGFTDKTFYAGQKLTLIGAPARREDNVCGLTSFKFSDGTEVLRNGALPEKYKIGAPIETAIIDVDEKRPEFLENGQPNISGYWVRAERGGGPTGRPARGEGGGPPGGEGRPERGERPAGSGLAQGEGGPPGARGRRAQPESTELALAEQAGYQQIYDNPAIECDITNIFFGWEHDANVNQVTQEDDKITLLYGYMDAVRTIHLNMDEHPNDIVPSRVGHSIGSWDGKTLVVDTVGFTAGLFNGISGVPYGANMHAVEKFTYNPEKKTLLRAYTATDPEYLKSPFSSQDEMIISDLPYAPYDCIELSGDNNRRPEARNGSGMAAPAAVPATPAAAQAPTPAPTTGKSSGGGSQTFFNLLCVLMFGLYRLKVTSGIDSK